MWLKAFFFSLLFVAVTLMNIFSYYITIETDHHFSQDPIAHFILE